MNESILREDCARRGLSPAQAEASIAPVRKFEQWLVRRGKALEQACQEDIRDYIRLLIGQAKNTPETLRSFARYFYLAGENDVYVYFTSLLGGQGVLESMRSRLKSVTSAETAETLFDSLPIPSLGAEPEAYPACTQALMERLENHLPAKTMRYVLSGNHHQIPASAFDEEREMFSMFSSLEEYLADRHTRQVAILQRHCDSGTVWFEQIISQEVVDYVAANQEILSAVYQDGVLYSTKIPYSPAAYLAETNPVRKRYLACHCPFVREAIRAGAPDISPNWCYCSGGFAKNLYEALFGRELRVELLQSVLKGDCICRFAIFLDET